MYKLTAFISILIIIVNSCVSMESEKDELPSNSLKYKNPYKQLQNTSNKRNSYLFKKYLKHDYSQNNKHSNVSERKLSSILKTKQKYLEDNHSSGSESGYERDKEQSIPNISFDEIIENSDDMSTKPSLLQNYLEDQIFIEEIPDEWDFHKHLQLNEPVRPKLKLNKMQELRGIDSSRLLLILQKKQFQEHK